MLRTRLFRTSGILMVVAMLAAVACSGVTARENVLLPAMRLAWPQVQADAMVAPTAAETAQIEAMTRALATGTVAAVKAVHWPQIQTAATRGIDKQVQDGQISEGVSGSLRERLKNFAESVTVFVSRN